MSGAGRALCALALAALLGSDSRPPAGAAQTSPPPHHTAPTSVLDFSGPAGTAPDPRSWTAEIGGNGWGNHELQSYSGRIANASRSGTGTLVITARREALTGSDGIARQYTSARLTTAGKRDVPSGSYVEASIRAPVGAGVWPAFWLVGSDLDTVGWPAAGELDVLEGAGEPESIVRAAVHLSRASDPHQDAPYGPHYPGGTFDVGAPLSAAEHRYGVYFDEWSVHFYVDRRERMVVLASRAVAEGRTWPFGAPMHILLNVAVGGGDPGRTPFPKTMTVGPVSIWTGGIPF